MEPSLQWPSLRQCARAQARLRLSAGEHPALASAIWRHETLSTDHLAARPLPGMKRCGQREALAGLTTNTDGSKLAEEQPTDRVAWAREPCCLCRLLPACPGTFRLLPAIMLQTSMPAAVARACTVHLCCPLATHSWHSPPALPACLGCSRAAAGAAPQCVPRSRVSCRAAKEGELTTGVVFEPFTAVKVRRAV